MKVTCPECRAELDLRSAAPQRLKLDTAADQLVTELRVCLDYFATPLNLVRKHERRSGRLQMVRRAVYAALMQRKFSANQIGRYMHRNHASVIGGARKANPDKVYTLLNLLREYCD